MEYDMKKESEKGQIEKDTISKMDEGLNKEAPAYTLQNSSEALLSIQRLDFKTSFLEAVEELRMRRDAEINYEEQISKFVVEKQELELQKEALQHQKEALNKQHTEAMAAIKKQFQVRMLAMEEEKGKCLLAEESKEREMEGLKETLKKLQVSKYTLQKKLNEMEQKLQLHMLAKEDHQKSLNEFEKCHAVITVMEATQLNKRLTARNKRQESEIDDLKEELKKVTADLVKANVTCQRRVGEENLSLTTKEQELQEIWQRNCMEKELNTTLIEENAHLKEEKQVIIASLQHMQQLLSRQTEVNAKMELEMNTLKEKCHTLERDNELQREKAKENEQKFLNLQNEYEKRRAPWKNKAEDVCTQNQMHTSHKDNKYTQTAIDVFNNLAEEETGVTNILPCSFDSGEMQTEQNSGDSNTTEENSVCTEDYLCVNEDDKVCPLKSKQRELSVSIPVCTVSFITPVPADSSCIAECKESAAKGKAEKKIFDKTEARRDLESSESCCSLTEFPVEDNKKLLENAEDLGSSNQHIHHSTKLNKHLDGGITNEFASERNKNINNALHEEFSFASEDRGKKDNEHSTNNHLKPGIDSVSSQMTVSHTNFHNDDLDDCSEFCKVKQTSPSYSTSCVSSQTLSCKQINISLEEIYTDNTCRKDGCFEQISSSYTPENAPPLHDSLDNHLGDNVYINNEENINNLLIVEDSNLNAENPSKDINEMPKRYSDKDSSKLRENSVNKVLLLNSENTHKSQTVDVRAHQVTRDEEREFHMTDKQFVMGCDEEDIPLKEREESLKFTVTDEIISEGNSIGKSGSLPIKITEHSVQRNVMSALDIATIDKITQKNSAKLNLPMVYQDEIQSMCTSASKLAFSIKEKRFSQELKNSQNSTKIGQTMNMYAALKEEPLVSTHSNRVADTLNTGSINPGPKRNRREEWNATAKTFYDPSFPREHVSIECPSGPQQKSSQLPSEVKGSNLSENTPGTEEKEWNLQNVFIKTQINNIEKFLHSESFCQPRKRKYDEDQKKAVTADKAEE